MTFKLHSKTGLLVSKSGKIKGYLEINQGNKGYLVVVYPARPNEKTGKPTRGRYYLHRLVAETYLGSSKLHVNHKDGSKLNNRLSNLEYVTRNDNAKHAHQMGLINVKGSGNGRSKLTDKDVVRIRKLCRPWIENAIRTREYKREFRVYKDKLCEQYSLNINHLNSILTGRHWAHLL